MMENDYSDSTEQEACKTTTNEKEMYAELDQIEGEQYKFYEFGDDPQIWEFNLKDSKKYKKADASVKYAKKKIETLESLKKK